MTPPRLACLCIAALLGCGEPTALDLSLVADPNVNSEEALLSHLAQLRLVVDSPQGLYPAGAERREGDVEIQDVDEDGAGELVARVDLADLGRLPLIRLERGGLDEQPLDLRLDGLGPGAGSGPSLVSVAAGGVQGLRFEGGAVQSVQVPFNLRAAYRPPRVTQVYPEDGSSLQPGAVGSVVLIFSKAMNPESLGRAGVITLVRVDSGQETPVPAQQIVPGEVYSGGPTRVDYRLASMLKDGSYRVRVSQGALDGSGRPLDQVPMQPGNQPFSSGFGLTDFATTATTCPQAGCEVAWCGNGGTACPDGLTCENDTCVPDGCPASCDVLTVCDTSLGVCVPDCRVHGTYCGDGLACDQVTGLCAD